MEGIQPHPAGLLEAESITDCLGSIMNTSIFQITVLVKRQQARVTSWRTWHPAAYIPAVLGAMLGDYH